MRAYTFVSALALGIALVSPDVSAATRVGFSTPMVMSANAPDFDAAYKGKPSVLEDGTILVIYGDAVENDADKYVFELHGGFEHPARDIFVRACNSHEVDCSDISHWSAPINISNTAALTSISTDWRGTGTRMPYYGDSENAHVFDSGKHIVITWVDKYCPGGKQRSAVHLDFADRELPMSCLYVAHSSGNYGSASGWSVEQIGDGSRDAKQDSNRGVSSGAWVLTWQEDPLGLQPGEAEGPGEGASGARVSKGTDIWYAYTSNVSATGAPPYGPWSTPIRLTDNKTATGSHGKFNPVNDRDGNPVDPQLIDKGNSGASRANIMLVSGSNPPTAVVAYEETKGSEGDEEGKYIRYHVFPYNNPPDPTQRVVDPAERAGCIVSDPVENARRVRLVTQTNAGSKSGLRMAIFWRQGEFSQGAPADIVLRYGIKSADEASTGLRPADLSPTVDSNCAALDFSAANALVNTPAVNLSSNTPTATAANLSDSTGANSIENARAHRAILRGDDLYVAYTYTADGVLAQYTTLANYNLYLRRYNGVKAVWDMPRNLSKISDTSINVVEPRLVPTPGNGPGCSDPKNPTNPQDCQNKNTFYAAWGTETNVYDYLGGAKDLDIFITRTTDNATTFEPVVVMAGTATAEGESQLQATPDGNLLYAVWNAKDNAGAVDTWFALGTPVTLYADLALSTPTPSQQVLVDQNVALAWTVANLGPDPVAEGALNISLPEHLSAVSNDAGCTVVANALACNVGDIAVGNSRTVTIVVKALAAGTFKPTAIASSGYDDPVPENNSADASVSSFESADLDVTLTTEAKSTTDGFTVDVHAHVINHGPHTASRPALSVRIPTRWSPIEISTPCTFAAGEVTCSFSSLDVNATHDVHLVLLAPALSDDSITATVRAEQSDPDDTNNAASNTIQRPHSNNHVFGCALTHNGDVDPTLPIFLLISLIAAARTRVSRASAPFPFADKPIFKAGSDVAVTPHRDGPRDTTNWGKRGNGDIPTK